MGGAGAPAGTGAGADATSGAGSASAASSSASASASSSASTTGAAKVGAHRADDAAIPDASGQGRSATGAARRDASPGERTTPEADAGGRGATKDDAASAGALAMEKGRRADSGAAQPATIRDAPAPDGALPLPEVPDAAPESGDAAPTIAPAPALSKLAPLLGYWKQVDASSSEADFAPGGFDQCLLAIRPTQRSMQIYRGWGDPSQLVIAAEMRATFDLDGHVTIEENPSTPCRFSSTELALPARDGRPAKKVVPPARTLPCTAAWSMDRDDQLRLDGRAYRRMTRAEFEAATQSKPGAANAASGGTSGAAAASPAAARADEPSGGVDFFGTRIRGKFVCFICDISGSMEGDKLIALRTELTRSIQSLPAGSHFEVIFFSDRTFVIERDWVQAGSAQARAVLQKIQEVGAAGGTDPSGALQYAFTKLRPVPHEIFLLTDGQFGVSPVELLRQLNGGADRTRVHTFGLGQDADAASLRAIAQEYGGQYRAVSPTAP
jgi:hypothetical protein